MPGSPAPLLFLESASRCLPARLARWAPQLAAAALARDVDEQREVRRAS